MTTVVTGATGHIGANLVRELLTRGRPVRTLIHTNRQAIEGLNTEETTGDICDLASLCDAFAGAEVVYHLAARISLSMDDWPLLESVNVIGTRNVVEACLRCGVRRLVHFSSIHALVQEPIDTPVDESRPLAESRNHPPYDRSKATAEKEVRKGIEQGLDAIIINPTAIIGPHDYQLSHFGEALLALARGNLPALVSGGYDWVDVRDVVNGAICAEERAPTGARYIMSGHWLSLRDLAALVEEATGTRAPRLVCPAWLARIGVTVADSFRSQNGKRPLYTSMSLKTLNSNRNISHASATRDLDYQPRPFRETLIDTLQWFMENDHLADLPKLQCTETT